MFVICVQVRTYSEWVIDGEYDWPPTCCSCQTALEDGNDSQTTRLGCLRMSCSICCYIDYNYIFVNIGFTFEFMGPIELPGCILVVCLYGGLIGRSWCELGAG